MSKLQDLIFKTANLAREKEDYRLASFLSSIAVDCALLEERKQESNNTRLALNEALTAKTELLDLGLLKLAGELDLIAKDLEAQLIKFESEDPIEAVLSSYALIHRIASIDSIEDPSAGKIKQILEKAETEVYEDDELERILLEELKSFSDEDKKNILYILEKDYGLELDLKKEAAHFDSKTIEEKLKHDPSKLSKEQKEKLNQKSKETKEEFHNKEEQDEEDYVWRGSFPSSPPMWGGFSYQAIVPYQQTSQINFWSLASEEAILKRIAKPK